MKRILLILFASLLFSFHAFSQIAEKLIRRGNSDYKKGDYKEAEVNYRKGLTKDSNSIKGNFNLGDAIYKQENYDEATKTFSSLLESDKIDKSTKAKIYHNLGNSYLKSKKYPESIEAYKNALRNNSTDADTKYNLSYAMKMLQKQQQQQQDNDKNNDKNKQDSTKNNKDSTQTKQDDTQQKKEQKKDQISKSDAERMLEALNNKDKNLQDKLKEQKVVKVKATNEKDW